MKLRLPDADAQTQLLALYQQLLRILRELERRIEALETKQETKR
jgi:hypothetical protein